MKALKYIFMTTLLALNSGTADTTWTFTVGTTTDQKNSVSASGVFSFSDTGVFSGVVTNDSVDNSTIKGFWFLDPLSTEGEVMDVETFFTSANGWKTDTSVPSYMSNLIDKGDSKNYFGAFANKINDGLKKGEAASFSFQLDPATGIDPLSWTNASSELPTVALRWQQVGVKFNDSAKAVGNFMLKDTSSSTITPVPEPSMIALLGLVGLGGIVFLRCRRIIETSNRNIPAKRIKS